MTRPVRHARGRVAGSVALAATFVLAPLSSCKGTPTDGFQLDVPANVASEVAWYEVGIFPGPGCSALGPQLSGGVPSGYEKRLAFSATNSSPPDISDLPRAKYAIGVAARAADCSVLATGCSDVDLSSASSVNVSLSDVASPQGACTGGATCEDAECTPGSGEVGAGCSLQFIGAGPLADPLALVGTVMSAPAVAATPSGFLVAYREYDPSQGVARVTVIPVDNGGGGSAPEQTAQNACLESQTSDATGLLFASSGTSTSGLVVAARAGCGNDSGLDLIEVSASGALGMPSFADLGADPVFLSTAHSLATSAAGSFVAFTQGSTASVASVSGVSLARPVTFGGDGRISDAWVATSDQVVALLADGTPSGTSQAPVSDDSGAADGGDDSAAGADAAMSDDSAAPMNDDGGVTTTPSASTLRFNLFAAGDAGAPPFVTGGTIPAPTEFPGDWGSVAALAGRAFVASDGQVSTQPVAYRAFDVGDTTPAVTSGFDPQGSGPVLYADVAAHQDHLFFAVERQGAITLDVFGNATTTPTFLREVPLGDDPRIPTTANVRDGRVAVLATDTRVIVAWTTQEVLGMDDATGGYVVFACTTP